MSSLRASTRLRKAAEGEKQSYCKMKRKLCEESTNQKRSRNESTNPNRRSSESTNENRICSEPINPGSNTPSRDIFQRAKKQKTSSDEQVLDSENQILGVMQTGQDEKAIKPPTVWSNGNEENVNEYGKVPVENDCKVPATTTIPATTTTTTTTTMNNISNSNNSNNINTTNTTTTTINNNISNSNNSNNINTTNTIITTTSDNNNSNNNNTEDAETDRYLRILCRLYPHQSPRILELILKGCNYDVIKAIESILPTHVHTGEEWVPRDYACGSFPRMCDHGCEETDCYCDQTHERENGHEQPMEDAVYDNNWPHQIYSNSIRFPDCFGLGVRPRCCRGYGWGCGCLGCMPSFQNVYFPHCY